MTEEEAKTKWCPLAKDVSWTDRHGNRLDVPLVTNLDVNCIASDCMMWRVGCEDFDGLTPEEQEAWLNRGYCGLGGKP